MEIIPLGFEQNSRADSNNERQTQYRCTIHAIVKLYEDLSFWIKDGHKELMKKTPFKHLFGAIIAGKIDGGRKRDKIMDDLLATFDKEKGKFKFGSQYCKPSRKDVKIIFGIEDGTKEVGKNGKHGWDATDIGQRMFGKIKRISASLIKARISQVVMLGDETGMEDTVKLMCLLLFQSFFFPNTGSHIAWGYVYYIDSFERLSSYDWSTHIHKKLLKGLNNNWTEPTQVTGCTLFLLYWFAEHSLKMQEMFKGYEDGVNRCSDEAEDKMSINWIPRMIKWRLTQLESVIKKADLEVLKEDMFNDAELTPTRAEEMMLKSLNDNNWTEESLVVNDSDFEDPIVIKKRVVGVVRARATKVRISNGSTKKSGSHAIESSTARNVIIEQSVEDWGGPSFSLFQNESQDILKDNDYEGFNGELLKQRDEGLDNTNVGSEKNQPVQAVEAEMKSQENTLCNEEGQKVEGEALVVLEGERKAKSKGKVLEDLVGELEAKNKAQVLMIQRLETERNNADMVATMNVSKSVSYMEEIGSLRIEKNMLTKTLEAAMEKLGKNKLKEKNMDQYVNKMQDAMDSIQNQLKVKNNEHVEFSNVVEEKNNMMKAYELKVSKLEEELGKMQEQMEKLYSMVNELNNTIFVLKETVDERDKEVFEKKQRIEELENIIENNEDVAISNEVHMVTQLYGQNVQQEETEVEAIVQQDETAVEARVQQEQRKVEPSTMVNRVKERTSRKKRVKDEQFEYMLDKKLKDV